MGWYCWHRRDFIWPLIASDVVDRQNLQVHTYLHGKESCPRGYSQSPPKRAAKVKHKAGHSYSKLQIIFLDIGDRWLALDFTNLTTERFSGSNKCISQYFPFLHCPLFSKQPITLEDILKRTIPRMKYARPILWISYNKSRFPWNSDVSHYLLISTSSNLWLSWFTNAGRTLNDDIFPCVFCAMEYNLLSILSFTYSLLTNDFGVLEI